MTLDRCLSLFSSNNIWRQMQVFGFALLLCECTCVQIERNTSVTNKDSKGGNLFFLQDFYVVPNIRKWAVWQLYSQLLCRTDIACQIDANAPNSKICQRRPCLVLDAFNWPCLRNCKHSANGQTFTPREGEGDGERRPMKASDKPRFFQPNERGILERLFGPIAG